jgi:hypothetical protein
VETDSFGTFSGEKERMLDPLETARQKVLEALNSFPGYNAYLASEGSFYPHPYIPFIQLNTELVALYHAGIDRWFWAEHTDAFPVTSRKAVSKWQDAKVILTEMGLPGQAAILVVRQHGKVVAVAKGISTYEEAALSFEQFVKLYGAVDIEPDLRAMHSPIRRQNIAAAAEMLMQKLATACPKCSKPGFARVGAVAGLPCSWCGSPTRLPKGYKYLCDVCGYEELQKSEVENADPGQCDVCNP